MTSPKLNNYVFILSLLFLLSLVGTASADDNITFTTTGATFHPIITYNGPHTCLWTVDDSSMTNTSDSPYFDFGTAATRNVTLNCSNWSAIQRINLGNGNIDGDPIIPESLLECQRISNISGLENIAPYLQQICLDYEDNTYTHLNFDNFINLVDIECAGNIYLTNISLKNLPNLKRLNLENAAVLDINLTDCPNLEDLRAHQVASPVKFTWGDYTYNHVWHICVRDNPGSTMYIDFKKFPYLQQYWCWNDEFTGELRTYSNNLGSIQAYGTRYTSAYFYGQFLPGGVLSIYSAQLSKINIFNNPGLLNIDLHDNLLNQTEIDNVLYAVDLAGGEGGTLDISANICPSVTGMQYLHNIQNKSWTVTYDVPPVHGNDSNTTNQNLSFVQGVGTTPGQQRSYVEIHNVSAGNCLAVFYAVHGPGTVINSVTDGHGNTYIPCGPQYDSAAVPVSGRWFYTFPSTGGDITIQGHADGGDWASIKVIELSGVTKVDPVTFCNGATYETTQSVTTTYPNQMMLVGFHSESFTFQSISNGFVSATTMESGIARPVFYYLANQTVSNFNTTLTGSGITYGNWFVGFKNGTSNTSASSTISADYTYDKIDMKHGIVGFHDNSTGENITSWQWSFGDGSVNSTLQNPTHFYSGLGSYNVSLTVANDTMSSTSTQTIIVDPVITWSNPANITYGSLLNNSQLNAIASVDGNFIYTPGTGTKLKSGYHQINATFTPTDLDNYSVVNSSVTIFVENNAAQKLWELINALLNRLINSRLHVTEGLWQTS
jgi:PKD repeat protein